MRQGVSGNTETIFWRKGSDFGTKRGGNLQRESRQHGIKGG